jgi:hypothetical protein
MDMGMLGNMLAAGGQGFDYQQALDRQKQIYEDQRTRQATADARATTTFNEGQESYQHGLTRRPVVEGQQDARATAENTGLGLRNALEQHSVDRMPVTDQHQDEAFDTEQKLRKSQIANSGQEQSLRAMQIQMQRLGLSDAMVQHAVNNNQREIGAAFAQGQQSGDWSGLVSAYNHTLGAQHGHVITGLTQNKDGSFTASQQGGDPIQFKDQNALLQGVAEMNDPALLVHSLYEQRAQAAAAAQERAKDPKKFSELLRGDNGDVNAVDLTTHQVTPIMGTDGKPFRGTLEGRTRAGVANDAAESFYNEQVKNGMPHDRALEATQRYMSAFHPGVNGAWQGSAAKPGAPQAGGMAGALNQPAGLPQAGAAAAPAATGPKPPPGFRLAPDGKFYAPDPSRPGKFVMWNPPQ